MQMKQEKPRIAVVGTGGSISTPGRHSLDLFEYSEHGRTLEVDEFLAMFPEVNQIADLVPVRFRAIVSPAITPADWIELSNKIEDVMRRDRTIRGVVVTHGTDTVEETAYFLNLTLKVDVPVVMVAAQRPPNGFGTEAGLNLMQAIRVASSESARQMGVLVVLNDEIHAARDVTKTMNSRVHTFQTPDFGILGQVDPNGNVAFYRKPLRRCAPNTEFDVSNITNLPRVDIVYSYAGADELAVQGLVQAGAKGIVVACLPSGILPPPQKAALVDASANGVLVVQSRRNNSGRRYIRTPDIGTGMIAGDNLNPQKARVLTMLALSAAKDREEICRMFLEY
jgi:L-asparaginase